MQQVFFKFRLFNFFFQINDLKEVRRLVLEIIIKGVILYDFLGKEVDLRVSYILVFKV